jgi:hypothetical protein
VSASLKFDPTQIEITKINVTSGIMNVYAINTFSNENGTLDLLDGIAHPGVFTTDGIIAKIEFRTKKTVDINSIVLSYSRPPKLMADNGIGSNIISSYWGLADTNK